MSGGVRCGPEAASGLARPRRRACLQFGTSRTLIGEATADREIAPVQTRNGGTPASFGLIHVLDIDSATGPVAVSAAPRSVPALADASGTALCRSPGHARAVPGRGIAEIDQEMAGDGRRRNLSPDPDMSRSAGAKGVEHSAGLWLMAETLGIEGGKLLHALSFPFRFSRFEDDPVQEQNARADALVDCGNALTPPDRTPDTTPVARDIGVKRPGP